MLIKEKVQQALDLLPECGLDAWLTFTRESGINGDPSLAFLAPGEVTWHSAFILTSAGRAEAVVGQYDRAAIEETGAYHQVTGYVTGFREPLQECLGRLRPARTGINYSRGSEICDGLTYGMYLTLHELMDELGLAGGLVSAEPLVSALRERKTAGEIARIRHAVEQAEDIFTAVAGFIRIGRTEAEIAGFMREQMVRRGLGPAWAEATCPSVFTGPETAGAHYAPTERPVEGGHLVNIDFGVKVEGYCSDLQRSFYVLPPGVTDLPDAVRKGVDTIARAVAAARRALRPGVTGQEVDRVARDLITLAGYPEFPHGLGHQVGRYAHDGTALLGPAWEKYGQKPFRMLAPGMVFTIEPRLTVPGHGIASIEEMVLLTEDGAEWLSRPQQELICIPA